MKTDPLDLEDLHTSLGRSAVQLSVDPLKMICSLRLDLLYTSYRSVIVQEDDILLPEPLTTTHELPSGLKGPPAPPFLEQTNPDTLIVNYQRATNSYPSE